MKRLTQSFEKLSQQADRFTDRFIVELVAELKDVADFESNANFRQRFFRGLSVMIRYANDQPALRIFARQLGARHADLSIPVTQFSVAISVLQRVWETFDTELLHSETVQKEWNELFGFVLHEMQIGATAQTESATANDFANDTPMTFDEQPVSQPMGEPVIPTIDLLAEQSRQFAENASTEANSVEEAGHAMVDIANAIKQLADHTAHTATKIAQKTNIVQASAHSTVTAMELINNSNEKLNDMATLTATAISATVTSAN